MKSSNLKLPGLVFIACSICSFCSGQKKSIDQKVDSVMKFMTLEEKIGQMAQITLDVLGRQQQPGSTFQLDASKVNEAIVQYKLGSVLNTSDNKAMSTKSME